MAKRIGLDAMEPSKMAAVPKMDRVSVTFALMLDSFIIQQVDDRSADDNPYLVCSECTEVLCEVEHDDDLRTLFNTALAHTC